MLNKVINKVRDNSWLFLRRAIKELASHDDSNDEGLSEEKAIITTTFIQMSFELSLVAYFIKTDGIYGIVEGTKAETTEESLLLKFENNELITKSFNALKKIALERKVLLNDGDEYLVNEFQKIRNKLVHLNYKFDQSELYDLKYDLIYFIVNVVIPTLHEEEDNPSQVIAENIEKEDFLRLVKFPPYANEMHKVAKAKSDNVYSCIHCGNDSLAVDYGDEYCYSCCKDFSDAGFIDCPYCKSNRSMIYDALNIDCQEDRTLRGLCLKCGRDDLIFVCKKCGAEVALEGNIGGKTCCPEFCQFDE